MECIDTTEVDAGGAAGVVRRDGDESQDPAEAERADAWAQAPDAAGEGEEGRQGEIFGGDRVAVLPVGVPPLPLHARLPEQQLVGRLGIDWGRGVGGFGSGCGGGRKQCILFV